MLLVSTEKESTKQNVYLCHLRLYLVSSALDYKIDHEGLVKTEKKFRYNFC